MGQANKRGSFEVRLAQAIQKKEIKLEHEKQLAKINKPRIDWNNPLLITSLAIACVFGEKK